MTVPVEFERVVVTVEAVKVELVVLKRKDACGKVGSLVLAVGSGGGSHNLNKYSSNIDDGRGQITGLGRRGHMT